MAVIEFYEKPGCVGNARQKRLLEQAGHHLVVHNLLTEEWSAPRLRRFFNTLPVCEWFNRSSPRIKRGEVIPEGLDADAALALMVADPLLIRRPLMRTDDRYWAGFDPCELGGMLSRVPAGDLESCPHPGRSCDD